MQNRSFLERLSGRALWYANRTPASAAIKFFVRLKHRDEVLLRRRLKEQLSPSPTERQLAKSLNENGFVVVDDVVDARVLEEMAAHADSKLRRAQELKARQETTHKSFWIRLLDEDLHDGRFASDHPFVRFATQEHLINVIATSLGEIPQLSDVLLTLSEESNKELLYSQLWHRDHDDARTIKLFVYLTDVPSTDYGPFTFIPGPASDRFGLSLKSHLPDEKIFRVLSRSDVKEMTGPRCSTFIVDTKRCLHMGSRIAPGRHRLLYTATFISAPRTYREPPPRFQRAGKLDQITETVLFRSEHAHP